MNCWPGQQSSKLILREMLFLSHTLSRQPSTIDTGGKMLMRFFFSFFFFFHSRENGREREVNGTLNKGKTKTNQHPAFFFFFFGNKCFFSCMSNADMERGEGGGCWGNSRRRIHRRLNLLLSSAVIEQNKDRTQYKVLTPQHSRNEWNHYTSHCKHGVGEGRRERGTGEGNREDHYTRLQRVCTCVTVRIHMCVSVNNKRAQH